MVKYHITLRVPSHVFAMRCVFAQNHETERDRNISASLSLSRFRAKTQRIPDTWDGTLRHSFDLFMSLSGCHPMYPECVAFLRETIRVREMH